MVKKLIVAYRTQAIPGASEMPEFAAPKSYKKEEVIQAYVADKQRDWAESLKDKPHTGTFAEVRIADLDKKEVGTWKYREPGGDKDAVCLAVSKWILKRHPNAWQHSTHPQRSGGPDVIFVGFNPRLFLKMLGIECSLPANQPQLDGKPDPQKSNALPLSMWFGNSDHRDIGEAAKPGEFGLTWDVILRDRCIAAEGWDGPGVDAGTDLRIATELATQMGFLTEE